MLRELRKGKQGWQSVQNMDHSRTCRPDLHQHGLNVTPSHRTVHASGYSRPPYAMGFHYQERSTDGSFTWFSHLFELFGTWVQNQNFYWTIMVPNSQIRDLVAAAAWKSWKELHVQFSPDIWVQWAKYLAKFQRFIPIGKTWHLLTSKLRIRTQNRLRCFCRL